MIFKLSLESRPLFQSYRISEFYPFCVCDGTFTTSQHGIYTEFVYGSHYFQWQSSIKSEMKRALVANTEYADMHFMNDFCDASREYEHQYADSTQQTLYVCSAAPP
jgi:hypothetical protein